MDTKCTDQKCPIHGDLSTRGRGYTGIVVSDKMEGTVVVEQEFVKKIKKYDRYLHTKTKHSAHNPSCINAKKGDTVRVMECRKLSKNVSSTIIEKIVEEETKKEKKPAKKKTTKKTKKEEVNG